MTQQRDYNQETRDNVERKYFYGFDFDVMHPFVLRSFLPHLRLGATLELGSYQGHFTQRILPYAESMTCVEASSEAITEAKARLGRIPSHFSTLCSKT